MAENLGGLLRGARCRAAGRIAVSTAGESAGGWGGCRLVRGRLADCRRGILVRRHYVGCSGDATARMKCRSANRNSALIKRS